MFLVDSHCHLDYLDYTHIHQDINDVIKKAEANEVKCILAISTSITGFIKMKRHIGQHQNVFFSCGIHPLEIDRGYIDIDQLTSNATSSDVIAIGETGLDYHNHNNKYFKLQQKAFREHIAIGCKLNKPVIIHTRGGAQQDTLTILKEEKVYICGGVLHCFTDDKQMAKELLDLGLYISFSGIITFCNTQQILQAARFIPLDRILIETDAPYLSPVPYRGKQNQPAYVRSTAQFLAELKKVDIQEFAQVTTQNFCDLFNLKLKIN